MVWFRQRDHTTRGLEKAREVQDRDRIMANLGATEIKQPGPIADSAIVGGTTRAGNDPRGSVVDANLHSHDHPNLYVVGSQVFPSIYSNVPTLIVAALSARLGDHLKSECAKSP